MGEERTVDTIAWHRRRTRVTERSIGGRGTIFKKSNEVSGSSPNWPFGGQICHRSTVKMTRGSGTDTVG